MTTPLNAFFEPSGVAVIGASTSPSKLSHGILKNLCSYGFKGKIYPVNPSSAEILGLLCYSDIKVVPDPVDLAVIVLPAPVIPEVVESCGKRGIKAAIIISGGFQEIGKEGGELQDKVLQFAARYDMRLIGPNCVGNINLNNGLNTTFIKGIPSAGGIGFVSQSGAVCGAIVDMVQKEGLGFSHLISLGNEADVNESDIIEYLSSDINTRVIAAYVESIKDGQRFMRVTTAAALKKPVVILKAGKSEAGAKAVSSHTGSLAGSKEIYSSAFRQSGAIEAENLGDMLRIANVFDCEVTIEGDKIAIITNAGGPAALASDSIAQFGIGLSNLEENTKLQLKEKLVPSAQKENPIDMLGGANEDEYDHAMRSVLADDNVHACATILVPQALVNPLEVSKSVIKNHKNSKKPIIAMLVGKESIKEAQIELRKNQIPCLNLPEQLGPILGALRDRKNWISRDNNAYEEKRQETPSNARIILDSFGKQKALGEYETRQFLVAYNFPLVKAGFAETEENAVCVAEEIGYPVVMKIVSPGILHKSDFSGIVLGIKDRSGISDAFKVITKNAHSHNIKLAGILIEPFIKNKKEVIVGFKRDPSFGPVLLFGMGGIGVELFKDFANRVVPINKQDAFDMIFETNISTLLNGYRGDKKYDLESIANTLMLINRIALDFPQIQELEINPLLVGYKGEGVLAVDCRMILSNL